MNTAVGSGRDGFSVAFTLGFKFPGVPRYFHAMILLCRSSPLLGITRIQLGFEVTNTPLGLDSLLAGCHATAKFDQSVGGPLLRRWTPWRALAASSRTIVIGRGTRHE